MLKRALGKMRRRKLYMVFERWREVYTKKKKGGTLYQSVCTAGPTPLVTLFSFSLTGLEPFVSDPPLFSSSYTSPTTVPLSRFVPHPTQPKVSVKGA